MPECSEVFENIDRISVDLREGNILGSTEAALTIMDEFSKASKTCEPRKFVRYLLKAVPQFLSARPTSLIMKNFIREYLTKFTESVNRQGIDEAASLTQEIIKSIRLKVDEIKDAVTLAGSKRVVDGATILIHSYSTTLIKLLKVALDSGKNFRVYVTESRPIGEGKVTASQLSRLGIETTLIVDSAVRYVMKRITDVFFSADAVAANGAVVNKVGTSAIALAAKEARVRTYVVAGTYKFGLETVFGELVEGVILSNASLIIPPEDIDSLAGRVLVRAPVFDVTPPEYIDAIITELGLIAPQAVPLVIKEIFGWPPKVRSIEDLLKEVAESAS